MFWEYFFDGLAMVISITALTVSIRNSKEIIRVNARLSRKQSTPIKAKVDVINNSASTSVRIDQVQVYINRFGMKIRDPFTFYWDKEIEEEIWLKPKDKKTFWVKLPRNGGWNKMSARLIAKVSTGTNQEFYSNPFKIKWGQG